MLNRRDFVQATLASTAVISSLTRAAGRYDPGASDSEIVIGGMSPYSGPLSAMGSGGRAVTAFFKKMNDGGGINGRKLKFVSVDDAYNPAKTLEQARRLVESEGVLFLFFTLGTAPNTAIHRYMNQKKVPQLFVASGATKWGDPKNFPWTMGFQHPYQTEARIYASHILASNPSAKIAILYQNDDYGKDFLAGFKAGLGSKTNLIVNESSYEVTDPTVSSQVVSMKASGANVFFNVTTPKFAVQAMTKAREIGWAPVQYLNSVSSSIGTVMKPAGKDATTGVISGVEFKDPTDPRWHGGQDWQDYSHWLKQYMPEADISDSTILTAYVQSHLLIQVLKQAGHNLTRENIMKEAANLDTTLPMMLPGIRIKTSPTDYFPIEQLQLMQFNGTGWVPFGNVQG